VHPFELSRRGSAYRWASKLAESLFAVIFPSDCRICGVPLALVSRLPVCQECLNAMLPIPGDVCTLCGERVYSPYVVAGARGEFRCGLCRRIEPVFTRAAAYGSYESGLRELIHLLKFGGVRPAAHVLGRMLAGAIATLDPELPADSVLLIPVPLHRSKFRQRGFNQAELIARAAIKTRAAITISAAVNPAVDINAVNINKDRLRLGEGVLVRTRETASQIGLTNHQRRENLRGAFAVAQPEAVRGREVLVVDDVYTTGATVSECARVLRRAGATKVWVATVARTLKLSTRQVEIEPDVPSIEADEVSGEHERLAGAAGG
jgi:predicted amidophosphoribosyltransferase